MNTARRQVLLDTVRHLGGQLSSGDINLVDYGAGLCHAFLDHFGCARASLWRFVGDDAARRLRCVGLHTRDDGFSTPGTELAETDFRVYIGELLARGTFMAPDVRAEPQLVELRAYFDAHGVCSMLDTAFQINGAPFGVVCLEETVQPRTWSRPEQSVLREAAAQVSLTIARMGPARVAALRAAASEQTAIDDW